MAKKVDTLQCGSCSYLDREKVANAKNACSEIGKIPSNKACTTHRPDVFAVSVEGDKFSALSALARAVSPMSDREVQVLASLLLGEKQTRRCGYKLLQKVYVRVSGTTGDDYINNFMVGHVLDANREVVRITGRKGQTCITVPNDPEGGTIYTLDQFSIMRAEMLAAGRISDPRYLGNTSRSVRPLDELTDDILTNRNVVREKKRDSLVTLVNRMSREVLRPTRPQRERGTDDEVEVSWHE